jgi:hypothetical protein
LDLTTAKRSLVEENSKKAQFFPIDMPFGGNIVTTFVDFFILIQKNNVSKPPAGIISGIMHKSSRQRPPAGKVPFLLLLVVKFT